MACRAPDTGLGEVHHSTQAVKSSQPPPGESVPVLSLLGARQSPTWCFQESRFMGFLLAIRPLPPCYILYLLMYFQASFFSIASSILTDALAAAAIPREQKETCLDITLSLRCSQAPGVRLLARQLSEMVETLHGTSRWLPYE